MHSVSPQREDGLALYYVKTRRSDKTMNQSLIKIPSHTPIQTQTTWTHSASGSRNIWPSNQHPPSYNPVPSGQPEPLTLPCAEGMQNTELQCGSLRGSLGKGSLDTKHVGRCGIEVMAFTGCLFIFYLD